MARSKRILVMILVAVVVFAAVTGVAFWTASYDPDNPDPGLYLNGKRVENPGTAMTIGSHEITFSDYRHYYLVTKASIESYYGATIWDDDPDGEKAQVMRDSVETELENLYAWLDIADELGLELDEEDLAGIDETLAQQKEEYGTSFEKQLAAMYFDSEEDYLRITKQQKLSEKAQTAYLEQLKEELTDSVGAEADASYDDTYLSAKHILIKFAEGEEDTEKADADALARIEEILAEIKESEDPEATFDTLMNEYSEDTDSEGNVNSPEGYTFKEGDMVDEFYQTALTTAVGEISEPVASTYGYHIILRLPLSDSQKETNRTSAIDTAATEKRDEKLEEVKETLTITPGEYYNDITPGSIV